MTTATATSTFNAQPRKNGHPIGNILVGLVNVAGALFSLLPLIGNLTACLGIPLLLLGLISSTRDAFFNDRATGLHYTAFAVNAVAAALFMVGWWII